MSGISFFRSGSSLINDRLEKLEQSAATTEHSRVELMKQERRAKELQESEVKMHILEKRHQMNSDEITRRQRLITELNKKEQIVRQHISELTKKASENHGSGMDTFKEYSRQLDHIDALKKIQLSEIEHLDMQNRGIDGNLERIERKN